MTCFDNWKSGQYYQSTFTSIRLLIPWVNIRSTIKESCFDRIAKHNFPNLTPTTCPNFLKTKNIIVSEGMNDVNTSFMNGSTWVIIIEHCRSNRNHLCIICHKFYFICRSIFNYILLQTLMLLIYKLSI